MALVQIHPTLPSELVDEVRAFARSNDVAIARAVAHLLALGLKEMQAQHGGSIMHYLNDISGKDQEASQ